MEKAKISAYQLFVLMILFEHGSALVIGLGTNAKQDTWLAIITGMLGGLFLFFIYHQLYKFFPDLLFTSYVQQLIGSFFGKLLAFIYLVYFFYFDARVLRDFGELLLTFAYPNTPIFIINTIMILIVMYAINKGIEILARTGEIYFIFLYIMAISGFILVIVSGLIDLKHLKPILENGINNVLHVAFTQTIYFPFGESIAFLMILPYLNDSSKAKKIGIAALVLTGINLSLTMAVNVSVLGVDLLSRSPFPLLSTIQKIEVANFLERLDVFFMLAVIIGGFFKISVFFYIGVIGIADLFKINTHNQLIFPTGIVILILSMLIASNFPEHIKEGLDFIPMYLHIPLQVIIPILLLIIAFIKNKRKKQNAAES